MKVLLVADEFFSWGWYGGFGFFTRKLARELVKRGVAVDVFVQRISPEQKPVGNVEVIDGVNVFTLPRGKPAKFLKQGVYVSDADVIHSQCGMLDTHLTFINNGVPRLVTFQDLRTKEDLKLIGQEPPFWKRAWVNYVYWLYKQAVVHADGVYAQARLLIPKAKRMFGLQQDPGYLPNFIDVPEGPFKKSAGASVVWLGRLDPIKRPELCFQVAKELPDINFYVFGEAHDKTRDAGFRHEWNHVRNLHLLGFQSGHVKEEILCEAWMLINTSIYECLPVSFLEGLAHKCALLSTQNPDGYTEQYGMYVKPTVPSLVEGLNQLLYADNWKHFGEKGYRHVSTVHETGKCVEDHIKLYRSFTA